LIPYCDESTINSAADTTLELLSLTAGVWQPEGFIGHPLAIRPAYETFMVI
jgi:hypothetical protein